MQTIAYEKRPWYRQEGHRKQSETWKQFYGYWIYSIYKLTAICGNWDNIQI